MAAILTSMWLWGQYDRLLTRSKMKKYTATAPAQKPTFPTDTVSILIVTIDIPDEFPDTLRMCINNKPKEIIVVTIPRDLDRVEALSAPVKRDYPSVPIEIYTVPKPGRRTQMALSVEKSSGDILCFVDDDTVWPTDKVLPYLLAGFEDPKVAGVVGRQSAHITKERRNPDSLTPWEVAGIRKLAANNEKQMQLHASGGTIWCLTGPTLLLRTAAVKPGQFLSDWTNERFWGQLIQTGEDSFLTRWLREKGWKVFHQDAPEAEVFTDVKKDANYIGQLIRWRRNGFQAFIMQLFVTPGFWTIFRENPYFARKLAEELARPFLALVHFVGWVVCIWRTPIIALWFALWYVSNMVDTYTAFLAEYPWIGVQNIWAAVAMDYSYLILDFYGLWTVRQEGWLTRNDK